MYAERVLQLCARFGCLPSQLLAEPAELLGLLALEDLARGADDGPE